jgi:hypothetical protein
MEPSCLSSFQNLNALGTVALIGLLAKRARWAGLSSTRRTASPPGHALVRAGGVDLQRPLQQGSLRDYLA